MSKLLDDFKADLAKATEPKRERKKKEKAEKVEKPVDIAEPEEEEPVSKDPYEEPEEGGPVGGKQDIGDLFKM